MDLAVIDKILASGNHKTPLHKVLRDPMHAQHTTIWTDASLWGLGGYNETLGEFFWIDSRSLLDIDPPHGHISEGEFMAVLLGLELPGTYPISNRYP
jgi:hypothetical protein|tara:strand:- start:399 stop:689 length:291 start_codon:yes stop_codon:yes gene_type:complete